MIIKIVVVLTFISTTLAINLRNSVPSPSISLHANPIIRNPALGNVTKNNSTLPQNQTSTTLCNVKIFRKLRLPWLDAFGACKGVSQGSELVSLRNENDYNLVTTALRDIDSPLPVIFWTSGVDLVEEGVFSWMSDGSTVNMSQFWSPGQPDNLWESEHCIGLRRRLFDKEYKLTDENCHLAGAFVCAEKCPHTLIQTDSKH